MILEGMTNHTASKMLHQDMAVAYKAKVKNPLGSDDIKLAECGRMANVERSYSSRSDLPY